jgi:hypothetical protein
MAKARGLHVPSGGGGGRATAARRSKFDQACPANGSHQGAKFGVRVADAPMKARLTKCAGQRIHARLIVFRRSSACDARRGEHPLSRTGGGIMNLDLEREELRLLREMVESRVQELQPEIRRCQNYRYQQELKDEWECLRRLLVRLKDLECDVSV